MVLVEMKLEFLEDTFFSFLFLIRILTSCNLSFFLFNKYLGICITCEFGQFYKLGIFCLK